MLEDMFVFLVAAVAPLAKDPLLGLAFALSPIPLVLLVALRRPQ